MFKFSKRRITKTVFWKSKNNLEENSVKDVIQDSKTIGCKPK